MATEESLTLKINCHQVSDHYTANSTESLYSRDSQRYSGSTARLSFAERLSIAERPFSRENVPSDGLSIYSEKLYAVRVLLIF
jgi:hypothetical protein